MMPDRAGAPARAWQRMLSGRRLDLLDPSPLDVEITDIAHGLARVARWNGQTRGDHAFSVAQHSLLVEAVFSTMQPEATPDQQLAALLHDAPEYVIGDMISPFKSVVGGGYKEVEQRLQRAIHMRFGLRPEITAKLKAEIKRADQVAAYFEATELAGFSVAEASNFFGRPRWISPEKLDLDPKPVKWVEAAFLKQFAAI
ncbi:MAG: HD family hydrolase, partial [Mesorhizobium sp.]|nr:HD family hydrolase [Mesorhizobium sp.]